MSRTHSPPRLPKKNNILTTLLILVVIVILVILLIIYKNKQSTFTNIYNNNNNNYIEQYTNNPPTPIPIPTPSITQYDTRKITKSETVNKSSIKYPYFDCYLKLVDVNPKLVNEYMKYDRQYITNGNCKNAILHMTVEPCPTDKNGSPLTAQCSETALLTSSKGNPQRFTYAISPQNISKFFGINL